MNIRKLTGVALAASVVAVTAAASAAIVTETAASDDWVCTLETHNPEITSSQASGTGQSLLTRFVSVLRSYGEIALDTTRKCGFRIHFK